MTAEQIKQWKVERDIARDSGDDKLIQRAYDHRDDMMMECIQHQADRVKQGLANDRAMADQISDVKSRVTVIEEKIVPLQKTDTEIRVLKERGVGLVWGVRLAIVVGSVFGWETVRQIYNHFASVAQ